MEGINGKLHEVATPIGVLTLVMHAGCTPPFRLYGPDGREMDPAELCGSWEAGEEFAYVAYDLSSYARHGKKRRKGDQ